MRKVVRIVLYNLATHKAIFNICTAYVSFLHPL